MRQVRAPGLGLACRALRWAVLGSTALASGVLGCNAPLSAPDADGSDGSGRNALQLGVQQAALSTSRLASPLTQALGVNLSPLRVETRFTPTVLNSKPVSIILELERDPISVARAKAGGVLSTADEAALREAILADQAALGARVEALGGSVRLAFQSAYNGLSITVPRAALPALRADARVVKQHAARKVQRTLAHALPYMGVPQVWTGGVHGLHGENVKVAILDTGIDYTHADFGGPGTVQAYDLARASSTQPPDERFIGLSAPRIKGGIDLVGDDYDSASDDPARNVPQPDPNPIDCDGHGTHVAGIVGGSGVNLDGSKFDGPYDGETLSKQFTIAPGVAPRADLYSVRLFGCEGSVDNDVIVAAIEWAMEHDIDVINMSLGSAFADIDAPDVVAAKNAIAAGVSVVASAGNSGDVPYITGGPAAGDGLISVAAMDVIASFPGATFATDGGEFEVINANAAPFAEGTVLRVVVLGSSDPATPDEVGLGCSAEEYGPLVAGALVVTRRGICDRVERARLGQAAGAAAVAMINTDTGLPPFEGDIEGVTIPFFGVSSTDAATLRAAASLSASPSEIANPGFRRLASFSSSGPRFGDSGLKPGVTAPGVSIVSAGVGTGTGPLVLSGTSMAAPAVAGLAALTRQAHPNWSPAEISAAITSTADPSLLDDYVVSRAGTGVVQAPSATSTNVTVSASADGGSALNFGFVELLEPFSGELGASIHNDSDRMLTFALSTPPALTGGVPHSTHLPSSISIAPRSTGSFRLSLDVPVVEEGAPLRFAEVSGVVVLTPVDDAAGGVADRSPLRIPYYGVVRPAAALAVSAQLPSPEARVGSVTLSNPERSLDVTADFFDLGIRGEKSAAGCNDIQAVGVQSIDAGSDRLLVFAINSFRRCSNAAANEYDLLITNEAGDVYPVTGIDDGLVAGDAYTGELVTLLTDPFTDEQTVLPALAPTDSHDVFLFAFASSLGVSASEPRFSYSIEAISGLTGDSDIPSESGSFNAFGPAIIGVGNSVRVPPGGTSQVALSLDLEEFALAPSKGLLVTTLENAEALGQAHLFSFEEPSEPPVLNIARARQVTRVRAERPKVLAARPPRAPVLLGK